MPAACLPISPRGPFGDMLYDIGTLALSQAKGVSGLGCQSSDTSDRQSHRLACQIRPGLNGCGSRVVEEQLLGHARAFGLRLLDRREATRALCDRIEAEPWRISRLVVVERDERHQR
jgi:hypothetical protein